MNDEASQSSDPNLANMEPQMNISSEEYPQIFHTHGRHIFTALSKIPHPLVPQKFMVPRSYDRLEWSKAKEKQKRPTLCVERT